MFRTITLLITLITSTSACAEAQNVAPVSYSTLPSFASSINAFIRKGWEVEVRSEGDLNHDGQTDFAFVLRQSDPKNIKNEMNTNPRALVVIFAETAHKYKLILEHRTFIPPNDNPDIDDPLGGISIRRGNLGVTFHYWSSAGSWSTGDTTLTFRYQDGCFHLIGYDSFSMHRATLKEFQTSINYLTGKKKETSSGGEDSRKKNTTTASKLPIKPLKCIRDIVNGMEHYD